MLDAALTFLSGRGTSSETALACATPQWLHGPMPSK